MVQAFMDDLQQVRNLLRRYKVLIDSKSAGHIRDGEVKHFSVASGPHTVSVKVDWCESEPVTVVKAADQNVVIWCGARYNDWRCLFMSVVRPRKYVYVQRKA